MVESPKLAEPEVGADEKMEDVGSRDPVDEVEAWMILLRIRLCFCVIFCLYILD